MFFARIRAALRPVSVRLALWLSLLFLIVVIAVNSLVYVVLKEGAETQEENNILFRLDQYSAEYRRGGLAAVEALPDIRRDRLQIAFFVRLAAPDNRTLYLRDPEDWEDFHPARLQKMALPATEQAEWLSLKADDGDLLLIAADRMPDNVVLQVGKSTQETAALLARFRNASVLMLTIFFPASIVIGALFAARTLRPIQALTRTMLEIDSTHRFDARMPSSGTGDELDRLVQVFNQMLRRIETLIRGMRESLDNVAHDLRTPITRLRHKAQSALLREAGNDVCRETLSDCIEEADRVMTVLNTLMDIAEAEAGVLKIEAVPVDATHLAGSVLDLYAPVAEEKEVALTMDVQPDLRVRGDPVLLRRVFANLVENALKFTPRGGAVRLDAKAEDGTARFVVADTGAGIPAEDLPRIWDRLYRGDKSRSERGLGLGQLGESNRRAPWRMDRGGKHDRHRHSYPRRFATGCYGAIRGDLTT